MSGDPLSKRLQPEIDELEPAARRLWSHKRKVKTSYDDIFYRPPDHAVDNTTGDGTPAKKKRRTDNSSKGKPRVTPCTGCILRMAENGPEHVCCYTDSKLDGPSCYDCARNRRGCNQVNSVLLSYLRMPFNLVLQPVGKAAKLGEALQKMALGITNGNTKSYEWSTKMEWTRKSKEAKASVKAIQETPGVAPEGKFQNRSEESKPRSAPDGKVPHTERTRFLSNNPTPIIKSEQHDVVSPQSMSVPGSVSVPQLQDIPRYGPPPLESQLQGSIARLEMTMNRIADNLEANNSLLRQLIGQSVKNTNDLLEVNRENCARLDTTNKLLRQMLDKTGPSKEGPEVDLLTFE
ncbi:hypothetical protein RAB80_000397 [Fusarium oxysporum f. sp. vasinfectum]|uniref:Uncharacterized protein n=1 Tax=Fusarium oxysporum f. sp. vasinfectum 25433 TaxID=1089449 RepID=X0M6M1_FUSOX|nr:hypothetical protein FOTG_05387 [Fusarium oxysporum f. sp. vasinfectum 25433]KAK2682451.1 hypothetical protein RAB80_000397 [Fusarium oxysporum f. sp. vasinfectum]KAK2938280.1 hypothetical protein FoTM2_001498 [Fusarium oxysporum f. sp. vasinfectum]